MAIARVQAALFGTLAVALVWWLALKLFDRRVAWIAASLAAFYPGAVALSVLVLSEAPFCPLMLLQLVLWIVAWKAPTSGRRAAAGFGSGLIAGAATLMRPEWLLFTPLAAVVSVLTGRAAGGGSPDPRVRVQRSGDRLTGEVLAGRETDLGTGHPSSLASPFAFSDDRVLDDLGARPLHAALVDPQRTADGPLRADHPSGWSESV